MKKLLGMRVFVTLLCLVLALAVFASCDVGSGDAETTGSGDGDNGSIVVANAVLTVPATEDADLTAAATLLLDAVKQYTGADLAKKNDAESVDGASIEILLGSTNRSESASALEALNGQKGYVVKKVGSKIVINATSSALLDDAVTYFVNNYVSSGKDGSFTVADDLSYTYGATGGFALLGADNKVQYSLIYDQTTDTQTNDGQVNNGIDYTVSFITKTWLELEETFEVSLPMDVDFGAAKDENLEILVGRTNRPETMTFLNTLKPNEYGYGVVGNKLVICGWSDLTTGKAVDLFLETYDEYVVEEGGVKNLVIAEGESVTEAYEKWNVDIPMHTGGELNGAVELINNAYELYYINSSADAFKEYRKQIEAAGYDLWQENQIGDNLYATYYSNKMMIHTYYMAYNHTVKVIAESMKTAILPQNEDPNMGDKVTELSFTTFDSDEGVGNWGNCFIITLEDGSFILHDGAANYKRNGQAMEREELYGLLKKLNKRKDGRIVIAAWVISHQHFDHFANAYDVIARYYGEKKNEITVEKILFNVAAPTVYYNGNNPNYYYEDGKLDHVTSWTGAEQVVLHTGQTIQIRNLKLEVLYTTEDLYPEKIETFNNSTLVHRFAFGTGSGTQTMTITGDIQDVASELMVEMYGEHLKTDILQVAHHGWGGTQPLYALFKPTVVVWPKDWSTVNDTLNTNNTGYYPQINQSLMNQKNVKLLIVSDDGHRQISLPLLGITDDEAKNEKLVVVIPRADNCP